jgi:phage-related tail fiber protein
MADIRVIRQNAGTVTQIQTGDNIQTDGLKGLAGSGVSVNNQKLTSVADPTSAQDAATKSYVDSVAAGLDWKEAVRAATTANITLSGTQTVDGVSLAVDNRVLVKDQSTGADNGIYLCKSGAWVRTTDADISAEVTSGMAMFVSEGTANADTGWLLQTNDPITLGTTALVFVQFNGTGTIVAGNGLVKTGSTIDVVAHADGSIVANADDVKVGVLATDAQHGVRGGGTQHALVTPNPGGVAGFMDPADKLKLNNLAVASFKAGQVLNASFTGNPKKATVTFTTPYADTNYAISMAENNSVAGSSHNITVESKAAASFVVNLNANNITNMIAVMWQTQKYGEQ